MPYRYGVTFDATVYFGDTITAKLVVREKDEERNTCIFTPRSRTRERHYRGLGQ
ncbi:hypothetical protein [Bradyrhizobium sp. 170]|uniref:hypothetical protein n=1 Tax=Bradyrhizobium sp. 170 TaxID=2782641 RepID=UPI001FFF454B|nr:hypothetical protein [Bradyrhizobium sp. 170]